MGHKVNLRKSYGIRTGDGDVLPFEPFVSFERTPEYFWEFGKGSNPALTSEINFLRSRIVSVPTA